MKAPSPIPGPRRILDRVFVALTWIALGGVALLLGAIALILLWRAMPAITAYGLGFLTATTWNPVLGQERYGALSMIVGTLLSSAIALFIALPLGLGTAIFLSEDFLPAWVRQLLRLLLELLAAIPSVVYGLWGLVVLVPFLKPIGDWLHTHFQFIPLFSTPFAGPSLLTAALVLAIMILPLITSTAMEALIAVPNEFREAAMALGATRWKALFGVLIPAAVSGITGGIVLALGRAMGETMAVTMLIGNSNRLSPSLLAPGNTIAALLANQFASAKNLQIAALMYAALVLLVLSGLVNFLADWIIDRSQAKYRGSS